MPLNNGKIAGTLLLVGGMARMMAYPALLWIIGLGGYLLGASSEKMSY